METTNKRIEREEYVQNVENDTSINLNVPKKLNSPDPIIQQLLQVFPFDYDNKDLSMDGKIHSPEDVFLISVSKSSMKRSILILDTFIKAAKGRGHTFEIKGHKTCIKIGDRNLELRFWEKGKYTYKKNPNWSYETRETIPTGVLCFQYFDIYLRNEWADTAYSKLEEKLGRVLGSLEFISKEETIKWKEIEKWHLEYQNKIAKQKDIEERRQSEIKKVTGLLEESEKWQKANQLRSYISFIETNRNKLGHLKENLSEWILWATAKADWLDPTIESSDDLLDGFSPIETKGK